MKKKKKRNNNKEITPKKMKLKMNSKGLKVLKKKVKR